MKRLSTINYYNTESILLILGVLLLFTHYYIFPIDPKVQMVILLTLVILVGVPHGALDFLVDEQTKVALQQNFSIKKFVILYLFRLFSFALIWIFPWVAFSIFMVFSIYHFGETDMAGLLKTKKKAGILYVAYGAFILGVLLLVHLPQIKDTLPVIKNFVENSDLYLLLEANRYLIIMALGFIFIVAIVYQKSIDNPVNFLKVFKEKYGAKVSKFIVTVPSIYNLHQFKNMMNYLEIINSDHRFWFTPYTIAKVLVSAGYNPEKILYANLQSLNIKELIIRKIKQVTGMKTEYPFYYFNTIIITGNIN